MGAGCPLLDICGGRIALVKDHFSVSGSSAPTSRSYYPTMRTIKMTRDQFRTYRLNGPPTPENPLGGRGLLKKQLLEQNNGQTFRLMTPMGQFLGSVRGENNTVTTGNVGMAHGIPSPESCLCKQFAGTVAGSHHPVCQHRAAWEAVKVVVQHSAPPPAHMNPAMNVVMQKVAAPIDTTPKVQHMQVPAVASTVPRSMPTTQAAIPSQHAPASAVAASVSMPVVMQPAVVALIPPDQCDCAKFTKPSDADPKQHHFICQHYDKWKVAHPTKPRCETCGHKHFPNVACDHFDCVTRSHGCHVQNEEPKILSSDTEKPPPGETSEPREDIVADHVLVDLDTQVILRDATSDEVEASRAAENETGAPLIRLDETMYAVVPRPSQQTEVSAL